MPQSALSPRAPSQPAPPVLAISLLCLMLFFLRAAWADDSENKNFHGLVIVINIPEKDHIQHTDFLNNLRDRLLQSFPESNGSYCYIFATLKTRFRINVSSPPRPCLVNPDDAASNEILTNISSAISSESDPAKIKSLLATLLKEARLSAGNQFNQYERVVWIKTGTVNNENSTLRIIQEYYLLRTSAGWTQLLTQPPQAKIEFAPSSSVSTTGCSDKFSLRNTRNEKTASLNLSNATKRTVSVSEGQYRGSWDCILRDRVPVPFTALSGEQMTIPVNPRLRPRGLAGTVLIPVGIASLFTGSLLLGLSCSSLPAMEPTYNCISREQSFDIGGSVMLVGGASLITLGGYFLAH